MSQLFNLALIIQLIVLVNPLSSVPALLSAYKSKMNVKQIAISASFIAFLVAFTFCLIGPSLFAIFGIGLDSFRIAGGVILILLGVQTIWPEKSSEKEEFKKIDSLISIIATPLLTGPATISFITIKAVEVGRFVLLPNIVIAFVFASIIFFIFALAIPKINQKVIEISSKIFGLFLTAIGIELIITGIKNAFLI